MYVIDCFNYLILQLLVPEWFSRHKALLLSFTGKWKTTATIYTPRDILSRRLLDKLNRYMCKLSQSELRSGIVNCMQV